MTAIQLATAHEAEELSRFAETSFTHTFGHIYAPADLAAFLAGWNPPARIAAQIADPDWTIALIRGGDGAILGFTKLGPIDFDIPAGHPTDDATELHQLYVAPEAKGTGVAAALIPVAGLLIGPIAAPSGCRTTSASTTRTSGAHFGGGATVATAVGTSAPASAASAASPCCLS